MNKELSRVFRFATYIVVTCHMSELDAVPVFCRSNVLPTTSMLLLTGGRRGRWVAFVIYRGGRGREEERSRGWDCFLYKHQKLDTRRGRVRCCRRSESEGVFRFSPSFPKRFVLSVTALRRIYHYGLYNTFCLNLPVHTVCIDIDSLYKGMQAPVRDLHICWM